MSPICTLPVVRWCALIALVTVAGCADTFSTADAAAAPPADAGSVPGDDAFGLPPDYGAPREAGKGPCTEKIDVVFVLDVSSSMTFVLDKLGAEIDLVVNASNKLAPDSHFGLVTFVDNFAFDTTGPQGGGKVHVAASTLKAAFSAVKLTYTFADRNPGDGPNGPTQQNPICEENALDAVAAAATQFPWRAEATRVIIVATDDTFLERPDNYGDRDGDGKTDKLDFPREGNYPAQRTVAETVAALRQQKVRVFSFARFTPPGIFDLLRCGTGRRLPWSEVSAGWSTPYKGQKPLPAASDGEAFDLAQVFAGKLSLTETINNVVLGSRCKPIL